MTQTYPHLGFNPAPGTIGTVAALQAKLKASAQTLEHAHQLVERLRAGSSWKGDAAVAFREELDGALPDNLKKAHTSLLKAATALGGWEKDLTGYQDQAKKLDGEAKAAKDKLGTAQKTEKQARGNPDLKLAGQTFPTDAELQSAQSRLNHATTALNSAVDAVNNAQSELDSVLKRARDLQEEHSSSARNSARTLRDATDKLAPEEPGWFESAVDWLKDNLTDVLGAVAAIAGLLALIATGPLGIALMFLAAAASAATLSSRLADPKVWPSLKDGFTKGEFDADFWSNAVGIVGDAMGVIPGASAVARGAVGAFRSASAAGETLTLAQKLGSAGTKTMLAADRISRAENPLTTWLVKGAADPARAAKIVDFSVAGAGAGTGVYGVGKNMFEDLKNENAEKTSTGLDAARAATFDGAGHGNTLVKTLRVLLRAHS
ncbi:hypothetical protein [Streptomyces sp. NPDC003077]|uniref:hypothetical protein n=1 Tax=Streptomyces sp. NPDC003077 TaxID=3154443 RepID=UPI0033AC2F01